MDVGSTCRFGLGSLPVTCITYPIHNTNIIVSCQAAGGGRMCGPPGLQRRMALRVKLRYYSMLRGDSNTDRELFERAFFPDERGPL